MAAIIWTEPALSDLQGIADYIALDDPVAAKRLVGRIFTHVEKLIDHPRMGSIPADLRPMKAYRQIVGPPCRIFHRKRKDTIYVLHVMRGERLLRRRNLTRRG
jgi:plasmid stabilization system protein ParE